MRLFRKLSKKGGWVLEGFPFSAEQVGLLFSKENIPQTVFNIKAEYADSRIQEFFQKFNPIPIKNSSFVNHQTLPLYEFMELEFSQKLNDTFKELSEKSIPVETINWSSSELANLTKVLEVLDIFVPQAGKNMNIYNDISFFKIFRIEPYAWDN